MADLLNKKLLDFIVNLYIRIFGIADYEYRINEIQNNFHNNNATAFIFEHCKKLYFKSYKYVQLKISPNRCLRQIHNFQLRQEDIDLQNHLEAIKVVTPQMTNFFLAWAAYCSSS